jgi:hypothetical protein
MGECTDTTDIKTKSDAHIRTSVGIKTGVGIKTDVCGSKNLATPGCRERPGVCSQSEIISSVLFYDRRKETAANPNFFDKVIIFRS